MNRYPPCIMCVHYLGGVQYRGLYHEYCRGYLEYRGECSVPGGISGYMWGYHEYRGV